MNTFKKQIDIFLKNLLGTWMLLILDEMLFQQFQHD